MMSKESNKTSRTPILDALLDEISPVDARKVEDRMVIAARIADIVRENGWSKSLFADKVGQLPSVISKWLSGTHNFTLDTLTVISVVLEVPLSEFFREKLQPLVFKSSFAVTGGLIDRRMHGGLLHDETIISSGPCLPSIFYGGETWGCVHGSLQPDTDIIFNALDGVSAWITIKASGMATIRTPHHGSHHEKEHDLLAELRPYLKA
jgi:transcriptional regulator with XRE-family HTH domain